MTNNMISTMTRVWILLRSQVSIRQTRTARSPSRRENPCSTRKRSFVPAALTLASLLVSALASASDPQIKKGTQLNCPKDGLQLVAAEAKHTQGKGHGFGSSLLMAGVAMAQGMNQGSTRADKCANGEDTGHHAGGLPAAGEPRRRAVAAGRPRHG